jgi:peptide/nickel transport system substrate-binding protein
VVIVVGLFIGLVVSGPAVASTLKIAADGDISDVDLHMTTHYLNRVVLLNVYDMLFALGEDMGPRPSLVDKHTVSPDGLVYTLALRRGVKFHSGKILDAKDVVYSITKMQNKGPRSGQFKKLIKSIEAPDALTVKITLNEVNAGFVATLANPIAPAVIYPDGEAERQGGTITKPVGTGPFEFVEWKKDSVIRLKKFADYTVDDRPTSGFTGKRLPMVDQVDFIPIRDSSVRAAALERGDVDVALALTQQDVERYKGKPDLTVAAKPGVSFSDLRFGFKKGIFMNNQKLRQAVAYAIDKEEIVKAVTFGLGKPAPAGIPVGTPSFGTVHANDPFASPLPRRPSNSWGRRLQGRGDHPGRAPAAQHLPGDRRGAPGAVPGCGDERARAHAGVGGPAENVGRGGVRVLPLGPEPAPRCRDLLLPVLGKHQHIDRVQEPRVRPAVPGRPNDHQG